MSVLLLFAGASAARETSEPQVPSESGDSEEQGKDERGAEEREMSEEDMEDAAGGQKSEEDAPLGEDLREVSIDDFDVPDEASFEPLWDADWDPNLAFRTSGCVLDLASGAKADAIGEGYYFFASLTIPLQGCRPLGMERRFEKPRAKVMAVAHEERDLGLVEVREIAEPASGAAASKGETKQTGLLPLPRGFLAEFRRRVLEARGVKRAEERIDSLIRRERTSGLLPELRLRGAHGFDQSLALASVGAVPGQSTTRDGSDLLLEARLTFRLNRLVVGDSEVALERARQTLFDKAEDAVKDALGQLLIFRKASVLAKQDDRSDDEKLEAELQAEGARIRLHMLTGGWFPLEGPLPSGNSGAN